MGLRGIPEGRLHFDGCRVPREHVLVGPPDGFKKLMEAYNSQRLGAATVALGLAQGAYELALASRGPGSSAGPSASSRASAGSWPHGDQARRRAPAHPSRRGNAGPGFPDALEAAKAKTFAAEIAQEVTGQALQIHGAAGYGRGLPLERMARDARMFAIGGGTVEMMRNLIADRLLPTRTDFRR